MFRVLRLLAMLGPALLQPVSVRLALRMRMYLRVKANATVGYDVNYTYVVGDDSQRHRWQCTTSLVPQLQLYPMKNVVAVTNLRKHFVWSLRT